MIGECVMFAKHEGKNYYLSVATHDESTHHHIRELIDRVYCMEFPFPKKILEG